MLLLLLLLLLWWWRSCSSECRRWGSCRRPIGARSHHDHVAAQPWRAPAMALVHHRRWHATVHHHVPPRRVHSRTLLRQRIAEGSMCDEAVSPATHTHTSPSEPWREKKQKKKQKKKKKKKKKKQKKKERKKKQKKTYIMYVYIYTWRRVCRSHSDTREFRRSWSELSNPTAPRSAWSTSRTSTSSRRASCRNAS